MYYLPAGSTVVQRSTVASPQDGSSSGVRVCAGFRSHQEGTIMFLFSEGDSPAGKRQIK